MHLSYINDVSSQEIDTEILVCLQHDDIQFYFLKLNFRLMKIQKQIGIAYVLHNKIFLVKRKTRNWLDFLVNYIYINNQTILFSIVSRRQPYKNISFIECDSNNTECPVPTPHSPLLVKLDLTIVWINTEGRYIKFRITK